MPSYLVLAELAVKRVLRGDLPRRVYPAALRERARELVEAGGRDVRLRRDYTPREGG